MPAFYELDKGDAGAITQGPADEAEPRTGFPLAFAGIDDDKTFFVLMSQWHEDLLLAHAAHAAQFFCSDGLVVLFVNNEP